MRIGAIVLAGGEGKRFGGNKLIVKVGGKMLIQYVLEALEGLDRVIVGGKYIRDLIENFPSEIIIYNPFWKEGMSTSLKLGLRFFNNYDGVIIALGDMPLITREIVQKIINAYDNCKAVVPVYGDNFGNPVLIGKELYKEIEKIVGDIGARYIIKNLKKEEICKVECGEEVVIDVDTPEDLILVSQKLTSRPL
ncbi:MAG: nucleotidyltransferase family protein [Sulfolobaceae archaeon]